MCQEHEKENGEHHRGICPGLCWSLRGHRHVKDTISNWLYSYSQGVQWRQDYNVSDGYHLPRRIKSPPNQISSYKVWDWRQEVTDVAAVHGTHSHLLQCLEMLLMPHLNSFRLCNGHIWLALGTFLSSLAQIVTDEVVVYSFSFFIQKLHQGSLLLLLNWPRLT